MKDGALRLTVGGKNKEEANRIALRFCPGAQIIRTTMVNKIYEVVLIPLIPSKEEGETCWCGDPIDESNPDCVEFKLCACHAMDT